MKENVNTKTCNEIHLKLKKMEIKILNRFSVFCGDVDDINNTEDKKRIYVNNLCMLVYKDNGFKTPYEYFDYLYNIFKEYVSGDL